jgi:hypothetical protein
VIWERNLELSQNNNQLDLRRKKRKKKYERERMTQGKGGTRILNVSDEIILKNK